MLDKLKQAGNLLKEAATDGIDELKNSNLAKKVENAVDDVKEFADETVDSVKEKVSSEQKYVITLPEGTVHENCTVSDIIDFCWRYDIEIKPEKDA